MSFGIQAGGNGWGGGSSQDVYTGMLTLRGWHDATGGGYTSWQLASTSQGLKYRQETVLSQGYPMLAFLLRIPFIQRRTPRKPATERLRLHHLLPVL